MLSKNCVSERVMRGESASDTFSVQPIRLERGQLCPHVEKRTNANASDYSGVHADKAVRAPKRASDRTVSVQRQWFELRQFMFHEGVVPHHAQVIQHHFQAL